MASFRTLVMLAALAGGPPPAQENPADRALADLWQTVQACRQLQDDPTLAPHHIGVRVRSRVAVLWGPVPSADLALRAEARLRAMFELTEVRNELFVTPEDGRTPAIPLVTPPLILPEKSPPPPRETPRPFLRNPEAETRPALARAIADWPPTSMKVASAQR